MDTPRDTVDTLVAQADYRWSFLVARLRIDEHYILMMDTPSVGW